jgi:hypothetical protein
MLRARSSNAVYTLLNGKVFVPLTDEDIAVIRVLEARRLAKLIFQKISEVGWDLDYPAAVTQMGCNSLKPV